MTLTEKAAIARDAALEDLEKCIRSGHVPLVYDCTVRIVRLTRLTENFIVSGLGMDYYMMWLPSEMREAGVIDG